MILESVYGVHTDTTYTLDELLKTATLTQREAALRTMLTEDPVAVYLFAEAFREDMNRPVGQSILFDLISNLHCVGAHRIHWAVEKRPAEAFSLESWLDAIEYITKAPPPVPLERCEDAKQILLKGLM